MRSSPSAADRARLVAAAGSGTASEVDRLLRRPQDPDLTEKEGQGPSPLVAASRHGHVDIVQLLLEAGARKEIPAIRTPICEAAAMGHLEVVRVLMEVRASLDNDSDGACLPGRATPLFLAAKAGHAPVVHELLKARANVGGFTLHEAVRGGHTTIVGELLESGAPAEPLLLAEAQVHGHNEIFQLLMERISSSGMGLGPGRASY